MMAPNLDDLITPSQAAELRGVSRQAIDDLINRSKLKTWKIGGRIFVSRKAVMNYRPSVGGRPRKSRKATKVKSG